MDATGWGYGQCQNLLMYIYIQYVHIYMYICMLFPPGGTCVAYLNKKHSTVRCTDCDLLVPPQPDSVAGALRCARCQHYRPALRVLISWFNRSRPREHDRTDPSSHTPFQHLTTPEKNRRFQREHELRRSYQRCITRLKENLERAIAERGVTEDESLHDDLGQIMKQSVGEVTHSYPPGSFGRIFWENQQRASSVTDARSMRWDPLMVQWCLYLRHLSSSAYEMVRESGIIKLPSQRTLRDYTHHTKAIVGFSKEVDSQIVAATNLHTCEEREKYVLLIMDEMHIREDLVYDKQTGNQFSISYSFHIPNYLLFCRCPNWFCKPW